ncbi:hypothetical protein PInf_025426 [Phytophthora infestans]|nr:hypothetical protein PInf_025426 [Phytophthora infestans]
MGPALVSHSSICLELHTSEAKKKKKQKCDVSMDFAASLDRTGSKFFDLFDADPAQAREEMHRKRQEARERHGDDFFILTRLVYDQVVQDDTKPARRVPSAVDVAFALFGNNEVATEIARRMEALDSDGTERENKEFVRTVMGSNSPQTL